MAFLPKFHADLPRYKEMQIHCRPTCYKNTHFFRRYFAPLWHKTPKFLTRDSWVQSMHAHEILSASVKVCRSYSRKADFEQIHIITLSCIGYTLSLCTHDSVQWQTKRQTDRKPVWQYRDQLNTRLLFVRFCRRYADNLSTFNRTDAVQLITRSTLASILDLCEHSLPGPSPLLYRPTVKLQKLCS